METNNLERLEESGSNCLRCKAPMKSAGELTIRDGEFSLLSLTLFSPGDAIGKLLKMQAEVCAKCGKVELYL